MEIWRTTVAVAALLAVSGCAGVAPVSDQPEGRHTVSSDRTSAPVRMITEEAAAYYPADSWAGIAKTGGGFTVHRVPGGRTETVDELLRADFPDVTLAFADAKHPATVLDDLTRRIIADRDYWLARGFDITVVGPTGDGSGVSVSVATLDDSLRASLQERYAFADITVAQETVTPAGS